MIETPALPLEPDRPGAWRRWLAAGAVLAAVVGLVAPSATAGPPATGGSKCTKRNPCAVADTVPPAVAVTNPASASKVAGTITIAGTSSDGGGVAMVEVAVDGGAWTRASGLASWSSPVDTTKLTDGTHTFLARATDLAGNRSTTSVTVTVSNAVEPPPPPPPPPADTAAPQVAITSPTAGASVAGSVGITGTAGDAGGIAAVEVSVDGGAWQPASGTTNWSTSVDATTWSAGTHSINARATDPAGNVGSTSVSVTVPSWAPPPSPTPPATQGTWVSPEGVTIEVSTAGPWTIDVIYRMLLENARDLDRIGPTLRIHVQDSNPSQAGVSATRSGDTYTSVRATITLKGTDSTFASQPDAALAHEFGHVWTMYHLYISQNGSWSAYLGTRWSSADGSVRLGADSRLGTSYTWDPGEILADDYRLLFGSAAAVGQRPTHMNRYVADPRNQPGLRDWFLTTWAG